MTKKGNVKPDSEILAEVRGHIAKAYKGARRSHINAQAKGNRDKENFCDGAMATMDAILDILRGGKPV